MSSGPEPSQPIAIRGIIRGGRAHIYIQISEGGGWGLDHFQFVADLDDGGSMALPPRRIAFKHSTMVQAIVPAPSRGLKAVRVLLNRGDGVREVQYASEYELGNLLPDDDGRMLSVFIKSNRIKDAETLRFQATQIAESERHGFPAKAEVLKILAYSAMEELDESGMEHSLLRIDQFLSYNYNKGHKGHSKLNPDHMARSLQFIKTNLYLLLRRFDEYHDTMMNMRESVPLVTNAPIIAFNLSLALLVNAWILTRAGRTDESAELGKMVVQVFRLAAANMPAKKPKGFAEIGMSLQAASYAINLINISEGREEASWNDVDSAEMLAERFSRLTTPKSVAAIARRYEEAAQHLAPRQAPRPAAAVTSDARAAI